MTKDASFKKVVLRHAEETGQRYTEALTDLDDIGARMHHEPVAERLLAHLQDRYGIDATTATQLSVHNTHVFRIDRNDGEPWVARAFPPARPRAGVEGDAAILRYLERQGYPRSAWRSMKRCPTSTEARCWSPGSSMARRFPTAPNRPPSSSPSWGTCSDGCTRCRWTSPSAAPAARLVRTRAVRARPVRTC